MNGEFDRRRWFECGNRRSATMRDVLPATVRVRRNWVQPVYSDGPNTLFTDVSIVPFISAVNAQEQALFRRAVATRDECLSEFFARLFEAICRHIEETWLPRKVHVLFHSTGWDSRIIGTALKRVVDRKGPAWAGDIVLFSFGPEAETAQRIMLHEGWGEHQIVTAPDPADWLYPVLDMECAGAWLNGAHATIPVSRYSLIDTCRAMMCLPDHRAKVQAISGYGSSTLIGAGAECSLEDLQKISGFGSDYYLLGAGINRLHRWAERHYGVATSIPPALPHEILPWLSYDVLTVALDSTIRRGYELREQFVTWLDPELAAFDRVGDSWPEIPAEIVERMRRQYQASWYGRRCAPDAIVERRPLWSDGHGHLERSPWWSHWSAACYCERLRREGIRLT